VLAYDRGQRTTDIMNGVGAGTDQSWSLLGRTWIHAEVPALIIQKVIGPVVFPTAIQIHFGIMNIKIPQKVINVLLLVIIAIFINR
jgi:hypothetical protein